jgi:hypothetical protein
VRILAGDCIERMREHGEDGLRIVRELDAADRRREVIAAAGQLNLFAEEGAA